MDLGCLNTFEHLGWVDQAHQSIVSFGLSCTGPVFPTLTLYGFLMNAQCSEGCLWHLPINGCCSDWVSYVDMTAASETPKGWALRGIQREAPFLQ